MRRILLLLVTVATILSACGIRAQSQKERYAKKLLPSGADPFSFYKDGFYYYTHTTGSNLSLWKVRDLNDLDNSKRKVVWRPPANTMYSSNIWAPQIHFLRGKWYMYFAADNGKNEHHRMYVIENESPDPMQGSWVFKGQLADPTNKWAIDADVFEMDNQLYTAWSGWAGDRNGRQDIYIARMSNPWTISGERYRIASPQYEWELHGINRRNPDASVIVNEGPQFLQRGKKLFIIYSASGCWTDNYTLGMLSTDIGKNILDSANWKKHAAPVFAARPGTGVYGAGHNSFFKSPDGKEDWILYHANSAPGQGCGGHRSPRAQRFTWNKDGTPDFGYPLPVEESR